MQQNGFVQSIKCPTREFKSAVSLVDHVLVKSFDEMYFESDIMKTSITDHYAIFAKFSQNFPKEKSIPRTDFSFTKNEKLRNHFISKLQENLTEKFGEQTEINIATENFLKIIQDTMSEFIKLKNNRQKRSKPPWYDNHLKNQISKRNKLHTRFTRAPTSDNFSEFKHSRKHVKALLLKLKKKQYYNQLFKSSLEDKQSFFRNLSNLSERKNRSLVTSLYVKKEINKDSEIAESFNEHFIPVGAKLLSELQQDQINDLNHIEMTPFSCYFKRTTLNEVLSILKSLKENKSVGPDGIPSEVLKISSSVIGPC